MKFPRPFRPTEWREASRSAREPKSGPVVWLVNQYANSTDLPGITRHFELAQQLQIHGWVPRIFATAFHHNTATLTRRVSWSRPVVHDTPGGVSFHWLYSSAYRDNGWRRYWNMVTFTATLVRVGWRMDPPDVIIGSSPHLLTGLGAWILARRFRVPFLFEVRDLWPDMLVQLGLTSPLIVKPLRILELFLYRRADRVIAVSDGIADRIVAKGIPATKISMIPNSILRPAPVDAAERDLHRQKRQWNDKVVVVWAGAHNPMNGLDVVVEAARLLKDREDILFAFIGDGSLKKDLIEQSRELPNIQFYDPVPKTEIGHWLRAADIGILHSRRFEVFTGVRPTKLFDYMAASLPMVSSVPGETWQLVDAARAGVRAEWENPSSLADAIRTLADDAAGRRDMGQRGFDAVCQVHSREVAAARLADLLTSLCAEYHRGSPVPLLSVHASETAIDTLPTVDVVSVTPSILAPQNDVTRGNAAD